MSGYLIITADSLEAAVAKAKGCPALKDGCNIHVLEACEVASKPASSVR